MSQRPQTTVRFLDNCRYGEGDNLRTVPAGTLASIQERDTFFGSPVLVVRLPDGALVTALPGEVEEIAHD